jgi:hypothetical protein
MFKKIIIGTLFSLGTVYLGLSIAVSQLISPLYFQQVLDEKNAIVAYLISTRTLPSFQGNLNLYKSMYGQEIEDKVFYDERSRDEKIKKLEVLLEKNPYSRDTLYNLYLLHTQAGNELVALQYLNRAKQVDPSL